MLCGELVALRQVTESDLPQLEAWAADSDYESQYNSFGLKRDGWVRAAFAEDGFISDSNGKLLVATLAGELVGDVNYRVVAYGPLVSSRAYEIGITIAPAHRGKGYGAEAQRLVAAYLFATYAIERVQASTDVTNLPEQRALERAGFSAEGVLRRAQFRNGAWHDLILYSKLRGEA